VTWDYSFFERVKVMGSRVRYTFSFFFLKYLECKRLLLTGCMPRHEVYRY
jgi:hypothetical protein